MTASRRLYTCPACGEPIRHNHRCRRAGVAAPLTPMPADFRARLEAARIAATRKPERTAPAPTTAPLFDPEADV